VAHPVIYRLKAGHQTVVVPNGVRLRSDSEFPFSLYAVKGYDARMALVRILVDGYSLLHNWPELAPGRLRHSARAREELIHVLTRYHDATGTPVTIFFDGSGAPAGTPPPESNPAVEILFSCAGQTADDMIERAAHRFSAYGEVLAVTDDVAERDTVTGLGGLASSCANFIRMVENALTELQDELQNYNRAEWNCFNRSHKRDLK
jgi:predicted RNA-binding protein with PIN domain